MDQVDELRKRVMSEGLSRESLSPDPFKMFARWYDQIMQSNLPEPTAMCLATVDKEGQPWQRMVLLKTFDDQGFVFFTNYSSRKAEHIETNNKVSILFPWHSMGRQVKVCGSATKISTAESLKYFITRPRGSQIGAWASPQSKVITNRALLESKVAEIKQKYSDGELPLPSFWGGYRIAPSSIEFWQARENRLHDRFIYESVPDSNWSITRLAP